MTRPVTRVLLLLFLLLAAPATARADLTAFVGATTDPGPRFTKGLSVGFSLIIVGFEFEWSDAPGDRDDTQCGFTGDGCDPSLTTGMVNVLLQTPRGVLPVQLYGTAGVGVYRERFDADLPAFERQETNVGTNIGGGAKVELFGPLRLRLDYRVFKLAGDPVHSAPQRFYAGVNLAF